MVSIETREAIERFDRKGFVPSSDVTCIDDYLKESEVKLQQLQSFEADPHRFVADQLDIDVNFELVKPTEEWSERFYERFLTDPLSGILLQLEDFRTVVGEEKLGGKSDYSFTAKMRGGDPLGTTLRLGDLDIPILREWREESTSKLLCHETVHCVRDQHKKPHNKYDQRLCFEETIANLVDVDNKEYIERRRVYYNIISTVHSFHVGWRPAAVLSVGLGASFFGMGYLTKSGNPYLGLAFGLSGGVLPFISLILSNSSYANKTGKFFRKCDEEGLNPDYIYLRSDPEEFDNSKAIKSQLCQNDNLRFQIMSYKLGLK